MLKIFYGQNTFAKRLEVSKLKKEFIEKNGEYSVREFSAEEQSPNIFISDISSSGLFATKELIIIKRLEDNLNLLNKIIESNLEHNPNEIILLINSLDKRTNEYKQIRKHTGFTDFQSLPEAKLKTWITQTSKKLGFTFSHDVLQDLMIRTNQDQQEIWICLNQLSHLQKESIDKDDLDIFLAPSCSETAFNLLESALRKDSKKFQKSLKELELFREDPYQIVALLCSQAHSLVAVALGNEAGKSLQSIAGDIGIHPFVASQQAKLVRSQNINKQKSLNISKIINWLDLSLKTVNKTEPWPMIDATLMQITVL
ncbi:MAG TPA: DNA polymerase III subunit delta [Candidatus Saccharimonadales bacterium]|nr:DNA polymerase III subunit delta [Candidatus Saccharimonadales bacterium]